MPMTAVITADVTPKNKTKSNPLPRLKDTILLISVVGF